MRRPRMQLEQRIEGGHLVGSETVGELTGDMPLGQKHGGRDQALDDARPGRNDAPAPKLVQESLGDRETARGGERDGYEPSHELAGVLAREGGEAECLAQRLELLTASLPAGGIGSDRVGLDADLFADEAQRLDRDDLARPEQPAG